MARDIYEFQGQLLNLDMIFSIGPIQEFRLPANGNRPIPGFLVTSSIQVTVVALPGQNEEQFKKDREKLIEAWKAKKSLSKKLD